MFVRDCSAGTTTLASVLPDGSAAPGVSDASGLTSDGRYLAFENQNELYVRDLVAGSTVAVAADLDGVVAVHPHDLRRVADRLHLGRQHAGAG